MTHFHLSSLIESSFGYKMKMDRAMSGEKRREERAVCTVLCNTAQRIAACCMLH